jgi:hypothetical protein
MEMLRYFWDVAIDFDKSAKELDDGIRFPLCHEGRLKSLVKDSGLKQSQLK